MKEERMMRDMFFSLFEAAKRAEGELCQSGDDRAQQARKILAQAIDRCYEELQDWER